MRSFRQAVAEPRSGVRRASWIGVVACGALLLPSATALADHMGEMPPGVICPHASGEGPNALAPPGPGEAAPSSRAPSEGPLGAAGTPPRSAPAPASATKPASQVTKPATQVQTQRPAATTPQAVPTTTTAATTVRAVATAPVAVKAAGPRARPEPRAARRPSRAGAAERTAPVRRFNGLEPKAASPSSGEVVWVPAPVSTVPRFSKPATPVPLPALLGLLTLVALAVPLLVVRRRGGAAAVAAEPPPAPAFADGLVDAELHEIIAEARARELLGPQEEPAWREPVGAP